MALKEITTEMPANVVADQSPWVQTAEAVLTETGVTLEPTEAMDLAEVTEMTVGMEQMVLPEQLYPVFTVPEEKELMV